MPDISIQAGGDDPLPFFNADVGGGVGVHFRHQIEDIERKHDECVADDGDVPGRRPAETDIPSKGRTKSAINAANRRDMMIFCAGSFSCEIPTCLRRPEQRGVVFDQVDGSTEATTAAAM